MKPNHEDSIRFLRFFHPADRMLLNTIRVTGGVGNLHETFQAGDEDKLREFLAKTATGDLNVYFSVNPPSKDMYKKATRTDIARMSFLHVDLDPRSGEDLVEERTRLLALLTTNLPEGVPAPSAIVDSGGGYWGFWRLDDPMEIDSDESTYEEAKLYNLQLELLFGADACHNVDRIARLPGTVNYPDKRKVAKGRVESLSAIIEMNGASYDLSSFTKAAPLQTAEPRGQRLSTGSTIVIDENVRRVNDLDELKELGVTDFCRTVIAQGMHPDEPDRWASEGRSGALWYVVCELVRSGLSDDMIYAIITDPDWTISESVLDGSNGRGTRYARRQIERAREYAIDPQLADMNAQYAVLEADAGGRCRVLSDDGGIRLQSPSDFKMFYSNQFVDVGTDDKPKQMALGQWWFTHPMRRSFTSIVFAPGQETGGDVYNLWRGFAYDAVPGGNCDLYLAHIRDCICDGKPELFEYVISWMAMAVQQPDQTGHVAIVLRGLQGSGKGTFAKVFGALFGDHFKQVTNAKHVTGSFNAHLRDCIVLFADEAVAAGNRDAEGVLKALVTEENLLVEAKGVDASIERNYLHVIMASNDNWVVPTGVDDRRFMALDVNKANLRDGAYFEKMYRDLRNGGYEALMYLLRERDLKKFDPRMRPETDALRDQKELSFSPMASWWFDILMASEVNEIDLTAGGLIPTGTLTYDFNVTVGTRESASVRTLNSFLDAAAPEMISYQQAAPGDDVLMPAVHPRCGDLRPTDRPRCFRLPSVARLRAAFDATHGGPHPWPALTNREPIKEIY